MVYIYQSDISFMDLRIIGLSGRMGSGKDEVYKTATKLVGSEPIQRIAFGDMVKQEVADLLGLSVTYVETRKKFFRPLLQWWGTEYRRALYGREYWLNKMRDRLGSDLVQGWVFITDVRFENEAKLISDLGGFMVRIERPGYCMCEKTKDHCSETDLDFYDFDHTIRNDGEVKDLKPEVEAMIDAYRRERACSQLRAG